jgi:protein TonB
MARKMRVRSERRIVADRGDPLGAVMDFGRRATRTGLIVGFTVATATHGVFGGQALAAPTEMRLWAERAQKDIHDFLWSNYDIEVVKPPPAPEPEEKKEEETKDDEEKPVPRAPEAAPAEPPSPPPPAAQAGKLLTAPEEPDAPVDLTGDGFVTGNADSFVGGVTAAAGTGTSATYNPAASPTGKPGGTGTSNKPPPPPPKPTGPDRSRAATIASGANWSSCPFPSEADVDQVDYAVVTLVVTVRPDGTPRSVQVVSDPGHGFGRAARMCALSKRYTPAWDHDGNAIMGTTPPIRVTFTR